MSSSPKPIRLDIFVYAKKPISRRASLRRRSAYSRLSLSILWNLGPNRMDRRRFIFRRGLKIWPSFYLFLLFVAAFWFRKPSSLLGEQILYNLVWLQNYHASNSIFLIHMWSLAVEEHFYVLLPALLLLLIKVCRGRDPFWPIPVIFVLFSALCLASRWTLPPGANAGATQMRIDSLFAGVAL